jgi:predicted O-methyltransferase YrrM
MYSSFELLQKYLHYYLVSHSKKGHGIHSPFAFNFITQVLNDKKQYTCYHQIELLRRRLLHNKMPVIMQDFGAGSRTHFNQATVASIAKTSLKPKKYAQLLFRMAQYYKPQTLIELGTSLGITTAYLACAVPQSNIISIEGNAMVAEVAAQQFAAMNFSNIQLKVAPFQNELPKVLQQVSSIDFAFIDGNHRYEPTIDYFHQLAEKSNNNTIIVIDDIHWSKEMEAAWKAVQQHSKVTLTLDLFFLGIVFFRKEIKAGQFFSIRF